MDAAFLQAASPKPHVCFGLRLQPFTLGHFFLITDYGVNLDAPSWSDMILTVFICCTGHTQSRKNLSRRWAPHLMRLLGWLCRKRKMVFKDEIQKFISYLEDSRSVPKILRSESDANKRDLNAPECWRLLTMLMADFHMSKSEAMDTTVAEAHCLWATEADRRGTIELRGERVDALWEFARREDEKRGIGKEKNN
jgi:hypothetical protein